MDRIVATYQLRLNDVKVIPELARAMVQNVNPDAQLARMRGDAKELSRIVDESYTFEAFAKDWYVLHLHIPTHVLFERMGFTALLSILFGNTVRSKSITNVRLIHLQFPSQFYSKYKGPRFGMENLPNLGSSSLPLIALAVGLLRDHKGNIDTGVVSELIEGGVDIFVDNPFEAHLDSPGFSKRLETLFRLFVEKNIIYVANVTGDTNLAEAMSEEIGKMAKPFGVTYGVRLCPFSAGLSTVASLRSKETGPLIYVYSMLNRVVDGNPLYGISSGAAATVLRMMGADCVSIGCPFDETSEELQSLFAAKQALVAPIPESGSVPRTIPVITGGILPWRVSYVLKNFGLSTILHIGSGVWYSPLKSMKESLRAYRQAIELYRSGESLTYFIKKGNRKTPLARYLNIPDAAEIAAYDVLNRSQ